MSATMKKLAFLLPALLFLWACSSDQGQKPSPSPDASYLDYSGRADQLSGGVRMIPISTPAGDFKVYTKRVGNHPTMKVLLLHGGPGFMSNVSICDGPPGIQSKTHCRRR